MKRQFFWFAVVVVILLVSVSSIYAECPPGKVAITKPDFYGAVNPDKYNEMSEAIKNNDQKKLKALIDEKSVSAIPAGKKVCIIENSFYMYRKQISVPGLEVPYWVSNDALTIVE